MFDHLTYLDKVLFTKHLSVLIRAGIPLVTSLTTLEAQAKNPLLKSIIIHLGEEVKNGQSLARSLSRYPHIFDNFYLGLIEVGESSGSLEENLEFLAKQMAKDYNLRNKIRGALLYPGIVFLATFIMGGFISLFILPKLVDFFTAFETNLPLATIILLSIANFMKNYGFLFFGSLITLFIFTSLAINLPAIKPYYHQFLLRLPMIGNLIAYSQLSRFARNLGTLIKSGVPLSQSLTVTSGTLSNLSFISAVQAMNQHLTKGKNLADTLSQSRLQVFPPLAREMISVGEKTGKIDETLLYLGDFYEEEIDDISKNLSTTLEPILLIVIGLVVGFVALAIISPIYELTGSIRR
ncbi:MAG: type II secretion system F family protein [Candidatus Shapirobacteria bacterium]|jgi:type IV pilus assembly protein PilC